MRFKEHGFLVESSDPLVALRFLSQGNVEYFSHWFADRFTGNYYESLTEKQKERLQETELKSGYHLIAETRGKPFGEVMIRKDAAVRIHDERYKPPFYLLSYVRHSHELKELDTTVIALSIQLVSQIVKSCTLFVMLDTEVMIDSYLENRFSRISPEMVSSTLDTFLKKRGIENPYKKADILLRTN